MAEWAKAVAAVYQADQSDSLASLFHVQNSLVLALANELRAGSAVEKSLAPLKSLSQLPEYAAFRKFCQAFLTFMRDATPDSPETAYEMLEVASQPAQLVLRDAAKPTFAPTVRQYIVLLLELAVAADGIAPDRFESEYTDKKQKAVSSRCFNLIGASSENLGEDPALRKAALILFLTITLYRIFFSIQADIQQFISIETRLRGVKDFAAIQSRLPKHEVWLSAYYEGRAALLQRQLSQAARKLGEAVNMVDGMAAELWPSPDFGDEVLYFHAVATICTGRVQDAYVDRYPFLKHLFHGVMLALTSGEPKWTEVEGELDRAKRTHMQYGTYFLLREKLEFLCWLWLIKVKATNAPRRLGQEDAPPSVTFSDIAGQARRSFGVGDIDEADAECIAASLCEQKMIRGYCAHSRGLLVLAKGEAFPEIVLSA